MNTIDQYIASKESREYCSTCSGQSNIGIATSNSQTNLQSSIGDWFTNFWEKLKAGDIASIALTGLLVFVVISLIQRR